MYEDYKKKYIDLIKIFFKNISDYNLNGIPSFHIPAVGNLYETASSKLAIFGIETNGWGDLNEIKNIFKKDEKAGFNYLIDDFIELNFINWRNNFGTSFWDFNLQLLAKLYNINDYDNLINSEKYSPVLKSFIWGNTTSLERFHITAEKNKVDFEIWTKVKEQSKIFDNADLILETCTPNVLIILNWNEDESWISKKYNLKIEEKEDHFFYGHIELTDTHVFWLPHPRWIAINSSFEKTINLINDFLIKNNITFELESFYSIDQNRNDKDKKQYIGDLALFLKSKNMVMSGYELAHHLNRNNFQTSYGTNYSGGRGTFKLLNDCYKYFENKNAEISEAIASSFVKENGTYAYT